MSGNGDDGSERSKDELRRELRETRSKVRELENELAETNEGMIALTVELENAKERYQTLFEESSDAILLIDPEQNAIYEANTRACELLGYDYASLMSISASDVFPGEVDTSGSFTEAIVRGWGERFTCRTKNGKQLAVEISASKVTLDGQSLLLASLRDVTERKRREQRLQVLNRIFRHDLRNEGNVIQGHADILCDELAGSDMEPDVTEIQETIDDLLNLSGKVRRIQDVLDREQVRPRQLSELLDEQRSVYERRFPASTIDIDSPPQDAIVGQRLRVALREIVENACEHNDPDVHVEISAEIIADEKVRLTIEDDGSGIPDHERKVIRTGDETQLTHGSGVGLWVVRWIIDSLGGTLTIEDADPHGSLLSITLPPEEREDDTKYFQQRVQN